MLPVQYSYLTVVFPKFIRERGCKNFIAHFYRETTLYNIMISLITTTTNTYIYTIDTEVTSDLKKIKFDEIVSHSEVFKD